MKPTLAAVMITSIAVGSLLLFPTGDDSFECDRPPAWLLLAPATEDPLLQRDFFDEGYRCNHDARRRGVEALAALTAGAVAVGVLRVRR